MEITKNGHTTVIITTHYIDECAQAHMVSMVYPMKGKLNVLGMCVLAGIGRDQVSMAFWRPRIVCSLDL